MYEINLVCPECGQYCFCYNFETTEFECTECSWHGKIEDMPTRVIEV